MVHSARKHIRRHRHVDESPLNSGVLNSIMLVRAFHTDSTMTGSQAFKRGSTFRYLFEVIKHKIKCDVFAEGDVTCVHLYRHFTKNIVGFPASLQRKIHFCLISMCSCFVLFSVSIFSQMLLWRSHQSTPPKLKLSNQGARGKRSETTPQTM